MLSGGNPNTLRSEPAVDRARGALRETLTALRNLEQLLKSVRVGPRALTSIIPDVHASCQGLSPTLSILLASVATRAAAALPEATLTQTEELQAFALPRAKELTDALAKARRRAVTAKRRLELEHVVSTRTGEIDAVRALSESLDDALGGRGVHIELSQLAQQALAAGGEASGPRAHVSLRSERVGLELLVNPRVAAQLIVLGTSLVTAGGQAPAEVVIERLEAGGCRVRIHALAEPGANAYTVGLPVAIEPTQSCLALAAQLCQAALSYADGELTLSWGPEATRAS